jgi:hypothetical protein
MNRQVLVEVAPVYAEGSKGGGGKKVVKKRGRGGKKAVNKRGRGGKNK